MTCSQRCMHLMKIRPVQHRRMVLVKFWRNVAGARTFWGQVGLTLITNLVLGIIAISTGVLTARLLGPRGRGELAAIQSWPALLATLAMMGMPDAILYLTSRTPTKAGHYLASGIVVGLSVGGVFAPLGFWLIPRLLQSYNPSVIYAARVYLLVILVYALQWLPLQSLRALGAWRLWNSYRLLPSLAWLILLLAVRCASAPYKACDLSCIFLVIQIALILPLLLILRLHIPGPYLPQIGCFAPLIHYGFPSALNILPQTLNVRLDQLLMVALLGPDSLGYYAVAVAWSGAGTPLFNSISPVLFPRLSAEIDLGQQCALLRSVLPRIVFVVILLTFFIWGLTPLAIPILFGTRFIPAIPAALILVAANGFSALNINLEASLQGLGGPRSVLAAELAGLVATIICLVMLLRRYEIIGAAVSSLISYSITTALLVLLMNKRLNRELT